MSRLDSELEVHFSNSIYFEKIPKQTPFFSHVRKMAAVAVICSVSRAKIKGERFATGSPFRTAKCESRVSTVIIARHYTIQPICGAFFSVVLRKSHDEPVSAAGDLCAENFPRQFLR